VYDFNYAVEKVGRFSSQRKRFNRSPHPIIGPAAPHTKRCIGYRCQSSQDFISCDTSLRQTHVNIAAQRRQTKQDCLLI